MLDDHSPDRADDHAAEPAHPRRAPLLAVGTRAELRRAYPALAEERADGALCPALVNAHCHLELSALAGRVPGGDGVINWTRRLAARLTDLDPGRALSAAVSAAADAQEFGTGAMADVGNGTAGWRALGRVGLGGVFFHELVGSREARTGDALADAAAERALVPTSERSAKIAIVPAPHALYSVGPALLRRIFSAAAASGQSTTIHLAEDRDEILLLQDGTGGWPPVLGALGVDPQERTPHLSPTAYLDTLGAFEGRRAPLLVHLVHATEDDRRRIRAAGATVVLCPRSNLHIGGRLPDVSALLADGLRLAIGTDSLASVPNLSPWEEIATLAAHFPDVAPSVWLHAATQGGAAALGLDEMGALAPGKRPGLLNVRLAARADDDAASVERALVTDPHPHPHPSVRWIFGAAAA